MKQKSAELLVVVLSVIIGSLCAVASGFPQGYGSLENQIQFWPQVTGYPSFGSPVPWVKFASIGTLMCPNQSSSTQFWATLEQNGGWAAVLENASVCGFVVSLHYDHIALLADSILWSLALFIIVTIVLAFVRELSEQPTEAS